MVNNLDSNFTEKTMRIFLEEFESKRVMSKNVDTQLLTGKFDPSTGSTVNFKRPTDYVSKRTSDGDISGGPRSGIIVGSAQGTVQDYFTVDVDFDEFDESLKLDQMREVLAPMATRIVTDLELDFANFMLGNTALVSGTVGTPADTWADIANAGAVMTSHGVPGDMPWAYAVNPFTQTALANLNVSLGAGGSAGDRVRDSLDEATIRKGFAGMNVMTATGLPSYTTDAESDRAGTLTATPTVTYVGAKDTMTQALAVTAMGANAVVAKGETVQITGRNRLNLSTRELILDASGAAILWTATVTAEVTLGASGEGTLVCTGPAIFEAAGAFNTVDASPVSGDVITRLGGEGATIQPNLFWHPQAFGIGSVKIAKLFSTDTLATTKDGLQFRVSKYADGDANKQVVRVDFHPAYAAFNPFFAGQGFGAP